MESILAILFDVVWIWYIPALVESLAVALVLLSLESALARSRHGWAEARTFLLYLVFLKLLVPPQLRLPTGLISNAVGWIVSSLRSLPLELAGAPQPMVRGVPGGDRLWEYVHIEPLAALTWIWVPLLGWLLGFAIYMLGVRRSAQHLRGLSCDSITPPASLREPLSWAARKLDLSTIPRLRVSVDISAPIVFGLRRPTVLFPAALIERLSQDEIRQVCLHELAHVRRRDGWVQQTLFLLQALFWPNFLLARARRRLNHLQDLDCDAAAIRYHPDGNSAAYRTMLLKVAGRALGLALPYPRQGLGLLRRPSWLVERLRFTERRFRTTRRTRRFWAAATALLIATFLFPMGAEPVITRPAEAFSATTVTPLVEAVGFEGNRILTGGDLLQLVATRAGLIYDPDRLSDDVHSLLKTHLFGKVTGLLQVGRNGIIVRFELEETFPGPER